MVDVQSDRSSTNLPEAAPRQGPSHSRRFSEVNAKSLCPRPRHGFADRQHWPSSIRNDRSDGGSDLNLRTMEVNVLRYCVRNRIGKTKTESSCRPVPLDPVVLSALLEWRKQFPYASDVFPVPLKLAQREETTQSRQHFREEHSAGACQGRHRWQDESAGTVCVIPLRLT